MNKDTQGLIQAVIVPLLQAIITGLLLALAALAGWQAYHHPSAWTVFLGGLALFTCCAWLASLAKWRAWVDAILGIEAPKPAVDAPRPGMMLTVHYQGEAGSHSGVYADLPCSYAQLVKVAELLERDPALTHARFAGPHRPLSRAEFEALRDAFIKNGWARWTGRAHTLGAVMTPAGRAVMRSLARTTPHARED